MGWKMVRDGNEAWCRANGVSGTWRVADRDEAIRALSRKVGEEYLEFMEAGDPAELLDLCDVLDELLGLVDPDGKLAASHQEKITVHGRFRRHVMWCPVPGESPDAR